MRHQHIFGPAAQTYSYGNETFLPSHYLHDINPLHGRDSVADFINGIQGRIYGCVRSYSHVAACYVIIDCSGHSYGSYSPFFA